MVKDCRRLSRFVVACGAVTVLAGCSLSSVAGPPGRNSTGPKIKITQDVAASALLMVTNGPTAGSALASLVTATARPDEAVRIVQTGTPATTIVAADSPGPVTIVIPGPPVAPAGGQTAFESAQYTRKLKAWHAKRAAAMQAEAAQTREHVSAWLRGLQLGRKIGQLADPPADEGSLAAESAVAASAQAGLAEAAGDAFGSRRVIVLFCGSLDGGLPAGELAGDDVIVVTKYVATAAGTSAAQAALLGAGAAQAAVVGPVETAGQLAGLASAGLSQGTRARDSVSAPVLFGNGSYTLGHAAVTALTGLLPRLRERGVMAMISGFASTPGTAEGNYVLSFERATRVAQFFEAHGIAESSLIIVGHGTTDLVGSGAAGANRRVLVVVEEAAG
jgi:outer membrane protein OmpA-like peptidoglycan-associated protein